MTHIVDARDQSSYRRVVGTFGSGITIVTAIAGSQRIGMTCQSFVSASLEPPMIAVFLGMDSRSRAGIESAGHFCVSVLSSKQDNLARIFATPGVDKFRDVDLETAPGGCPVIEGALGWLECKLRTSYEVGDHRCIVGDVQSLGLGTGKSPLPYFRGGYGTFAS